MELTLLVAVNVSEVTLEQLLNALLPIVVTLLGIVIDVSLLQL